MRGFDIAGMPYSSLKTAIDDAERLFALLLSRIWVPATQEPFGS